MFLAEFFLWQVELNDIELDLYELRSWTCELATHKFLLDYCQLDVLMFHIVFMPIFKM
jgi:hypothetical protein